MKRTNFSSMKCPIARSLGWVGSPWSFLILRDSFQGVKRFDDFLNTLNIAPNILSRHLRLLVVNGMMEKNKYSNHRNRYEYLLTNRGKQYFFVVAAMLSWSNTNFEETKNRIILKDIITGEHFYPRVVNQRGEIVSIENTVIIPGSAATLEVNDRYQKLDYINER